MSATHIVLKAPHDTNGHPQRVSLLLLDGAVIQVFDHGYGGKPPGVERFSIQCKHTKNTIGTGWPIVSCEIPVSRRVYRSWVADSLRTPVRFS